MDPVRRHTSATSALTQYLPDDSATRVTIGAMSATPSNHAARQYLTTTDSLTARIAVHAYGTNPVGWYTWLAPRLPLVGDVLEVGAGTGALWSHRTPRGPTLTDFSPAMCRRLRAIPGAKVVQCDATRLPFADGSFDTVVANHMIYHLDDPTAALNEFVRVLRPGGHVAIATNGSDHLAELGDIARAIGRPRLVRGTQNDFTAQTGAAYLRRHFTDVTVERYPCDLDIPAADPVIAYLASMADDPLTPEQLSAARRIIEDRIRTHGSFWVRKHTVLMTAIRS